MQDGIITVRIDNMPKIMAAFSRSPIIAEEEFQKPINMVPDILAKYTVPGTVPYRTGALIQTFQRDLSKLQARWFPTRFYAPYVEFGTRFMKANPYMERILGKAQVEIRSQFESALERVTGRIASESK